MSEVKTDVEEEYVPKLKEVNLIWDTRHEGGTREIQTFDKYPGWEDYVSEWLFNVLSHGIQKFQIIVMEEGDKPPNYERSR